MDVDLRRRDDPSGAPVGERHPQRPVRALARAAEPGTVEGGPMPIARRPRWAVPDAPRRAGFGARRPAPTRRPGPVRAG